MTSAAGELTLEQAIAEFDASAYQAFEHEADEQRDQTLRRYPREHWAEMALEEYAQGQEGQPENGSGSRHERRFHPVRARRVRPTQRRAGRSSRCDTVRLTAAPAV